MSVLDVDVLKLLLSAALVIGGWFAAHLLANRRQDRTRRLETVLEHRERQIEELYGPLQALIEQVFTVWSVRERILRAADEAEDRLSREHRDAIQDFVWTQYFLPLHEEIRTVLRTKQHLLERGEMPKSFEAYLEHATQEQFQKLLWSERGIPTDFLEGSPWPTSFYDDVVDALEEVRLKQQGALRQVASGFRGA